MLTRWNGKDKSGKYQYPLTEVKKWNMMINEKGDILYQTENKKFRIWCIGSRLTSHLHHILVQIPAR